MLDYTLISLLYHVLQMCIGLRKFSECEFSLLQGTEFMANLSVCLRYYIADRLNNDPGWRNIKVSTLHLNVSLDSFALFQ